jgi:hypothetical protein
VAFRRISPKAQAFVAVLLCCVPAATVRAMPEVQPGAQLTPFTLRDQHAAPQTVDATTRLLLVTRDKDASTLVNEVLGRSPELLRARSALYVADISGMPGVVTKLFALPKMRKYPYRVLLARDRAALPPLPSREGHVTVLRLDSLRVTAVEHVATAAALRTLLERE